MKVFVSELSLNIGSGGQPAPGRHGSQVSGDEWGFSREPTGRSRRIRDDQFAAVVRPILGQLIGVAKRILRCDDLAWDAVQEALIALWLAGGSPPNPQAWLIRAVTHRSLHLARSRSRRRKNEELACRDRSEVHRDDDPSRAIEQEELCAKLSESLAELADENRMILELRAIDGLDYESIAKTLRIPIGTVRSRLNRSRIVLHHVVSPLLDRERPTSRPIPTPAPRRLASTSDQRPRPVRLGREPGR